VRVRQSPGLRFLLRLCHSLRLGLRRLRQRFRMHLGVPLGLLLHLSLDLLFHSGVGLQSSICQRLRQLPLVLLFLGIFVRLSLGLGLHLRQM